MKKLLGLFAVLMLFGVTNVSAIHVDNIDYDGSNVTDEIMAKPSKKLNEV